MKPLNAPPPPTVPCVLKQRVPGGVSWWRFNNYVGIGVIEFLLGTFFDLTTEVPLAGLASCLVLHLLCPPLWFCFRSQDNARAYGPARLPLLFPMRYLSDTSTSNNSRSFTLLTLDTPPPHYRIFFFFPTLLRFPIFQVSAFLAKPALH